ncbi:hypothetical protein A7U60_g6918 [Sanghuangporus baumii]|uniref:Uncharacterized protein n=1 Tax=Sanghuangporus baumii TaxID=108892 RepID=A0A9Q5HU34_SANBA|nr:hypothetical protein A7U60_g6918 [Sanghuangporus baumii]
MIITDAKKRREEEQILTVDKYLLMTCHFPPSTTTKAFERITTVDRENHRLSWRNIDYPSWALRAERWQVLTSRSTNNTGTDSTGKSSTQTHYETWEVFDGVLAYFVKWLIGRKLKQAFAAFADGLQTRCEG